MELNLGKHWNIGKAVASLYAFIKIPHAKVTKAQFFIGWNVGFHARVVWARGGVEFETKNESNFG